MRGRLFFFLFFLSLSARASTVLVTNVNDSGPGSLRDAIDQANAGTCFACAIEFNIPPPVPERGWFTIRPRTPLPIIRADSTRINGVTQTAFTGDTNPFGPEIELDGSDAGVAPGLKIAVAHQCEIRGLAINRFGGNGVVVDGSRDAHIIRAFDTLDAGNYIGVDPTGTTALPNGFNGIVLVNALRSQLSQNIIAGNKGNGVLARNCDTCFIDNNRIGAGRADAFHLPNGAHGVDFDGSFSYVSSNTIAFNALNGVVVSSASRKVVVQQNRIFGNGVVSVVMLGNPVPASAIKVTSAKASVFANAFLPSLTGVVSVTGTIETQPNAMVFIDVYASPYRSPLGLAEARMFVGSMQVTADSSGHGNFEFSPQQFSNRPDMIPPGGFVTVQATLAGGGSSSELTDPVPIEMANGPIEVTNSDDDGPGSLRAAIDAANHSVCTVAVPCWISFRLPGDDLIGGVARFEPRMPLPAITATHLVFDGASQTWWTGDNDPAGPEVVISGALAGGDDGLRFIGGDLLRARSFAVKSFPGNGIVLEAKTQLGITLEDSIAESNGGDGIVLRGGGKPGFSPLDRLNRVERCTALKNHGNGITIDGSGFDVRDSTIESSGGHGVFVASGVQNSIVGCAIAHSFGSGVATLPAARAVYIASRSFDNVGLPVDRNADGPTPNDADESDGIVNKVELLSATYNPINRQTTLHVSGLESAKIPPLPISGPASGYAWFLNVFVSDRPDQAERFATLSLGLASGSILSDPMLVADLRGKYVTATRTVSYCFWEAGCYGRDTSELSNTIFVAP
jgi:hypothetical protein